MPSQSRSKRQAQRLQPVREGAPPASPAPSGGGLASTPGIINTNTRRLLQQVEGEPKPRKRGR